MLRKIHQLNRALLEKLWAGVEHYFFPPLCVICDGPLSRGDPWLCGSCCDKLNENRDRRKACYRCGQNRNRVNCSCSTFWPFSFGQVYSIFDFDPTVQAALHQIKYLGKKNLAVHLGSRYAASVPDRVLSGINALIPVPLHPKRERSRGYNQAELFIKGFGLRFAAIPVLDGVLLKVKNTVSQTSLNRSERKKNMTGAFAVARGASGLVKGKRLLLVDDVVTTGATTDAAATALLEAGCREVRVLSVARD